MRRLNYLAVSARSRISDMHLPVLAAILVILVGCGAAGASKTLSAVDSIMNSSSTQNMLPDIKCLPKCSLDFKNYVEDAKRSQDPNTIQYCTVYPPTPGVKPFTIPIVGDFTGSNVSFFPTKRDWKPNDQGGGEYSPDRRSYDGMIHSSPLPYQYGFDAVTNGEHKLYGGAIMHCTDQPQASQLLDSTLDIKIVDNGKQLTAEINAALKKGDRSTAAAKVAELGSLQKTP